MLIRICCSYCVFLSALSTVLPKTYKPGLQGSSVRRHEIKQCFKTVQHKLSRPVNHEHSNDCYIIVIEEYCFFSPCQYDTFKSSTANTYQHQPEWFPWGKKEKLRHIESAYGALTAL